MQRMVFLLEANTRNKEVEKYGLSQPWRNDIPFGHGLRCHNYSKSYLVFL